MVLLKVFVFAFVIFAELSIIRTSRESTTAGATADATAEATAEATASNNKTTATTTTAATVECQPLPHDVLWKRIDRRRSGVDSANNRRRRNVPQTAKHFAVDGNGEWEALNQTGKRKRKERKRFRNKEPPHHVTFLGQQLPFDAYHAVGEIQDGGERKSEVASSRRKRKLSGGRKTGKDGGHPGSSSVRHSASTSSSSSTAGSPWQCRMEKKWKKMPAGIFPQRVQTGRCVAKTCMMALYECRPRKYATRILKRLDDRCNPLPVLGPNATYEEVWTIDYYQVTVACECARVKPSGAYYGTT